MEARLPEDKLTQTCSTLTSWLTERKATKRKILSFIGVLQHASKLVQLRRTFMTRMYSTATGLRELHYFTHLTKEFCSDMYWWHIFINSWNGLSFLHLSNPQCTFDWVVQTDASGSLGCRAFLSTQWCQYHWSDEWSTVGIMAKELVPIIGSCAVWGHCLARKTMEFQWGNQSLVAAINKGTLWSCTSFVAYGFSQQYLTLM